MLKHILVDMDGVLADFIGGVLDLVLPAEADRNKVYADWPPGEYDFTKVLGIDTNNTWRLIDGSPDFWRRLRPYRWTFELMEHLGRIAPVTISTSPSMDPRCAEQKTAWMQKMFGYNFRHYMIGPQKYLMAKPGTMLIDDSVDNVNAFLDAGGHGVVFPQPWNSEHAVTDPKVKLANTIHTVRSLGEYFE